MKYVFLVFACIAVFGLAVSAQTAGKVDLAKKIAEATPPELPQSPVDNRKGNDARDGGLNWKVKSVIEYTVDARDRKPVRKLYKESYYNEAGNLTKTIEYLNGYPERVTVFGYVDGMRVSRMGEVEYAEGERVLPKGMVLATGTMPDAEENSKTPKVPGDERYQTRYEYEYGAMGYPIEVRSYQNNGELTFRTTYTYEGTEPAKSRLELDFGSDGKEWSRTAEILFPSGDVKERDMYDAENKISETEIHQPTLDIRGNRIIDKTFEPKTVRGKKVLKPLWTSYRTITYYPDGGWEEWRRHVKAQDWLKSTTKPWPQKKKKSR